MRRFGAHSPRSRTLHGAPFWSSLGVRTCKLGPRQLEEEAAWIERYRQLWAARFDELDKVVEELKQREKANERRKRK